MKKKILFFIALVFSLFSLGKAVNANAGVVNVTISSLFGEGNELTNTLADQVYGDKIKVTPPTGEITGYTFEFWIVNGVVREDLAIDYEFTVTSNLQLQAVYRPNGKLAVVFIDSNGKLINSQFVERGASAVAPATEILPNKPHSRISEIPWISTKGKTTLTDIQETTVYILQYAVSDETAYTVTYNPGNGTITKDLAINSVLTLVAEPLKDEISFSHWIDENGQILSTSQNYKFTVFGNTTIEAVFHSVKKEEAVINMTTAKSIRDGYKSYVGQFELPVGAEYIESGFIFSTSRMRLTKDLAEATVVYSSNYNRTTGEFLTSFPVNNHKSIRAFLTYKDSVGLIHTIHSDYNEVQYIVSFESDGVNIESKEVYNNKNVTPTEVTKEGFDFIGWFTDLESEIPFDINSKINSNITLIAKWVEIPVAEQKLLYHTGFETATSKGSYAIGDTTSDGVKWTLNDALVGNIAGDKKIGSWSVRIQNSGSIYSTSGWSNLTKIEFKVARYSTDAASSYAVSVSKDGSNWIEVLESTPLDATTLIDVSINLLESPNFINAGFTSFDLIRVRISKTSGTKRINVDDIKVWGYA